MSDDVQGTAAEASDPSVIPEQERSAEHMLVTGLNGSRPVTGSYWCHSTRPSQTVSDRIAKNILQ